MAEVKVVVGNCEQCGGEIYLDEAHYRTIEGRFHEDDCLDEYAREMVQAELVDSLEGILEQ